MAALARSSSRPTSVSVAHSSSRHSRPEQSVASVQRYPSGPCNFRDLSLGRDTHNCGCRRFSSNDGLYKKDRSSAGPDSGHDGSAWCFCGHHACYHELESASSSFSGKPLHQAHAWCSPSATSNARVQCCVHALPQGGDCTRTVTQDRGHITGMLTLEHALSGQDQRNVQGHCVDALKSGLGISIDVDTGLPHSRGLTTNGPGQSPHPVPQILSNLSSIRLASDIPSSAAGGPRRSPCRAFMDHVSNLNRTGPPIDVSLFPSGYDLAQSATEVATPSNAGTPVMRGLDDAFDMVKTGIHDLSCDTNGIGMILPSRPEGGAFLARNSNELRQTALYPMQAKESASLIIPSEALPARIENLIAQIASLKDILLSTPNFKTSLFTVNHRLDALETTSFSHQSVDGLEQKVDLFDARLLEIEGKVDELEKLSTFRDEDGVHFNGRASKRRKSAQDEANSFTSHASFNSNASMHSGSATSKAEAVERLETLEERLEKLEASVPPCFAQPWEVEVVLLPWGRELKGIWSSPQDHFSHSLNTTSQRFADPSLPSRSRDSGVLRSQPDESSKNRQSQAFEEWIGCHDGWVSAYACSSVKGGTRGTIYKRLKSRGLVRIVNIHGNTAREVHFAICSAFEDIAEAIGSSVRETFAEVPFPLGLRAPLIPLRKIRKSSRLSFLSPAEIANPSIWTADFLESTVFMKAAGQRTLFITSPTAYLQFPDRTGEWTWQKLRELPRYQSGVAARNSENSFVAEADAKESCWTYNPRLDPSVSVQSSLVSRARSSFHSSFASPLLSPHATDHAASDSALDSESESDHEFRAPAPALDFASRQLTTAKPPAPITPLSEIPSGPRPFRRTISLPLVDPNLNISDQVTKRQINSFEQFTSPVKTSLPKRRRLSRTPEELEPANDKAEANPSVWNLTPRRSRELPSPYAQGPLQQQHQFKPENAIVRKRATTPSAYATPYSNTLGPRYAHLHTGGDGDTDMDDDNGGGDDEEEDRDGTRAEEEAWEGVDDDKDDGDVSIDLSSAEIDDDFSPGEEEDDADDDDDGDEVMGDAEEELE